VEGLLTRGSDIRGIKESVGWEPRVGRAEALFYEWTDDEGNPRTIIRIDATYDQSKLIEKALDRLIKGRQSEYPI
jgi:hypothetical protein